MNGKGRSIIAGVYRSRPAVNDAVVNWAGDEAAARGLPLHLVHAQQWPHGISPGAELGDPHYTWSVRFRASGGTVLDEARATALKRHPDLSVTVELAEGRPAHVLREASERAAVLVIGARRYSSASDLFAGHSKGHALVGHLRCPLALIPEPSPDTSADAPIVVGVDGSPNSRVALELAFADAAVRKTALLAVEVRAPREAHSPEPREEPAPGLSEIVADCREPYPGVDVECEILTGDPAYVLAVRARHARCLVVGSRGHGGFRDMLLGSTSRSLINSTYCPLLVAPYPTPPDRLYPAEPARDR